MPNTKAVKKKDKKGEDDGSGESGRDSNTTSSGNVSSPKERLDWKDAPSEPNNVSCQVPPEPKAGDSVIEIQIQRKEKRGQMDPLGVQIDETASVHKIQDDGPCAGQLQIGDRITHVDGKPINSETNKILQFNTYVNNAPAKVKFKIIRGQTQQKDDVMPNDWERYIDRHAGFKYMTITVTYPENGKKSLGLHIREILNHVGVVHMSTCYRNPPWYTVSEKLLQVLVSKQPESDCLVSPLKLCDRILEVNGAKVTSRDVTKALIKSALGKSGQVSLVIERPIEEGTYKTVLNLMENDRDTNVSLLQTPLPVDLVPVVRNQLKAIKKFPAGVCTSGVGTHIYPVKQRDEPGATSMNECRTARPSQGDVLKTVEIAQAHKEIEIVSDIKPSKKLRRVSRKF